MELVTHLGAVRPERKGLSKEKQQVDGRKVNRSIVWHSKKKKESLWSVMLIVYELGRIALSNPAQYEQHKLLLICAGCLTA